MKHEVYKNVTIMDHPLIIHKISKMRDVATSSKEFREYVNEIATLMGYEVTRDLPLMDAKIQTPLEVADAKVIGGKKLAVVAIGADNAEIYTRIIVFNITSRPGAPFVRRLFTHVSMLIAS